MEFVKITEINIYRYTIPLVSPTQFKNHLLTERSGLIIEIQDSFERRAYGEIAPLPGFHKENMTEALRQLSEFSRGILNQLLPLNLGELEGEFEKLLLQMLPLAILYRITWG